jgi:formylmethanofuran dehydrogenase subunit B
MSSEFMIWRYASVPGAAVFTNLRGFEDIFRFDTGQPLKAEFPADAAFHMNPDFPNDLLLPDNVANSLQVLLVSARLQEALQAAALVEVEYLPLSVIDHKGRVASASHVVVHPLGLVDAIDMEQSVYKSHRIVKGKIDKVTKLVIDSQRVPPDRQVFKLKGFGTPVIVRRRFAELLGAGDFSGLDWLDAAEFPRR